MRRPGSRRRIGPAVLAVLAAAGVMAPGATAPAGAQPASGRWVLERVDQDPVDPASGVQHTPGSITKDTPGPVARFVATYPAPPSELAPGAPVAIAVAVEGTLTSRDVRGEVGIDVIQLVDDRWTNVSVGAFGGCQPDPFPLGPLACREPVPAKATFTYTPPATGDTFAIGVGVLNTRAAVTWRYRFEAATTSTTSATTTVQATTTTTSATSTRRPPDAPRIPVILLPGVAGTTLYSSSGPIWPVTQTANRADMEMDERGQPLGDAQPGGLLIGPGALGLDFYGGMLGYLVDSHGYVELTDLFRFAYDWRWSNDAHFSALDRMVDEAIAKSGQPKVVLLAHSMGGLIARGYVLSRPERAAKVDAVVTMGTPFWGSPKVFYALVEGYTFGNPSVAQSTMKGLVQNFPAAYQLLPHDPFVWDDRKGRYLSVEEALDVEYERVVVETGQVSGFQQPNDRLAEMARGFHARGGTRDAPTPMPAGVGLYTIMGVGVRTLDEFAMRAPRDRERVVFLYDAPVVFEPLFGDGDGTVPLANLEIAAADERYYVPWEEGDKTDHGSLPASTRVQEIVGRIVRGAPPAGSDHPYTFVRATSRFDPDPGVDFILHSDAHLRIEAGGGMLGFDDAGAIIETLPGTFLSMNGVEYAALPADTPGAYDVTVTGFTTGRFDLSVHRQGATGSSTLRYGDVAVADGTRASARLGPGDLTAPASMTVVTGDRSDEVEPTRWPPWDGDGDGLGAGVAVALAAAVIAVAVAAGVARSRQARGSAS